jgi:hypothetical protein
MLAPSSFLDSLHRVFDGRLRCRWSYKRNEFHIEYKVAPGRIVNCPVATEDDPAIRARDGYAFVLAVRTGDRMPCPVCGYELKVPLFELAETKCDYCRLSGRDGRYPACYFPLNDRLIDYLRKIDPLRTWREGMAYRADAFNNRLMAQREREFENIVEDAIKDDYRKVAQIPTVYLGRGTTKAATDKE